MSIRARRAPIVCGLARLRSCAGSSPNGGEHGEIAQVGPPRRYGLESIEYQAKEGDPGAHESLGPSPTGKEEAEGAQDAQSRYDALRWGELAASYFALEDLCDMHTLNNELRRERAKATVREDLERRREERAEKRRLARAGERPEGERPTPVFFRGDVSTAYGLCASANGILRLYSAGELTDRRCALMLKALRLVALGRILGSGRPLKMRELTALPPGPNHMVEADTRPYEARRAELKLLRQRLLPRSFANIVSMASANGTQNKTDPSGSLSTRQIDEIADQALTKKLSEVSGEEADKEE